MKPNDVRELRQRYGWTQAELAARLGTDAVTVSRWERGVSTPRPSAKARLRELSDRPGSASDLVRRIGIAGAERALRRTLLLEWPARSHRFPARPATRLREVERARSEQLELLQHARFRS